MLETVRMSLRWLDACGANMMAATVIAPPDSHDPIRFTTSSPTFVPDA
jgi:hypothetical protein